MEPNGGGVELLVILDLLGISFHAMLVFGLGLVRNYSRNGVRGRVACWLLPRYSRIDSLLFLNYLKVGILLGHKFWKKTPTSFDV